jgi:hypothetical protein
MPGLRLLVPSVVAVVAVCRSQLMVCAALVVQVLLVHGCMCCCDTHLALLSLDRDLLLRSRRLSSRSLLRDLQAPNTGQGARLLVTLFDLASQGCAVRYFNAMSPSLSP